MCWPELCSGRTPAISPTSIVYCYAARAEGIEQDSLPDFLSLENGGKFALLGQGELGTSVFENALKDQIKRAVAGNDLPELDTERIILAAARVGQHVFALNVLTTPVAAVSSVV